MSGQYAGLRQLAAEKGIPYSRLQSRIRYGYTIEQALALPKGHHRRARKQLVEIDASQALRMWAKRCGDEAAATIHLPDEEKNHGCP